MFPCPLAIRYPAREEGQPPIVDRPDPTLTRQPVWMDEWLESAAYPTFETGL